MDHLQPTLSYFKHAFLFKAKFFPRFKVLRCISASSWGRSSKEFFFLFCTKLFFDHFSLMLHPDGFFFLALPTLLNWNAFTEWLVAPSPAASRPPIPRLLSDASLLPLQVALARFALPSYERAFCLLTSFSISGLVRIQVKPRLFKSP